MSRKYEHTKTVAKAEEAMARVTRTLVNIVTQVKRECRKRGCGC